MKSGPTAQDVAHLAQVSQSAVSRAFTEGASVAPATREKVLAAARTLGYRPNAIARSLSTRRSFIVALVMRYLENQFYPQVIERLSQQLQRRGYHVLMFIAEADGADSVMDEILQYQVDGIVLASATLSSAMTARCRDIGVPVVQINRRSDLDSRGHDTVSAVTSDNVAGGREIGRLLLARGHRRIAFLAGLEDASTSREREQGLLEALRAAGQPLFAREVGHYDFEAAAAATRRLFKDRALASRPDALFVANDHMAFAALDVLREELGLRVPQDVSVVGFDDVPQAAWGAYRLSTMAQDVEAMVERTVDMLLARIGQPPGTRLPPQEPVPCRWVERATLRPDPSPSASTDAP
jgi:DNA-binding LacI/PurR family transcriptional regulator